MELFHPYKGFFPLFEYSFIKQRDVGWENKSQSYVIPKYFNWVLDDPQGSFITNYKVSQPSDRSKDEANDLSRGIGQSCKHINVGEMSKKKKKMKKELTAPIVGGAISSSKILWKNSSVFFQDDSDLSWWLVDSWATIWLSASTEVSFGICSSSSPLRSSVSGVASKALLATFDLDIYSAAWSASNFTDEFLISW